MSIERYLRWKDADGHQFRPVSLVGFNLLNDRILNKGLAFSKEERIAFHLSGLIPPQVQTMEEQKTRAYDAYRNTTTDIQKYLYLRDLQDRNETLFYALIANHIEEMTPIIYTPTVGKACQEFSRRYQEPRGLYITPGNVDRMDTMVNHFPSKNIKIIVVTDSQGILGLGDLGIGGMGIPIGKLSLYTLGAGIHPACCLPIVLDVGTNNPKLLNDPLYLGTSRERITGEEYKSFIHTFVKKIKRHFPTAVLQWEDFSKSHAFENLNNYAEQLPSFNDDIQGTGAVVLAGVINAVKLKRESLSEQIYLIYGAGAGGVGVADQIYAGLVKEGMNPRAAREKIFVLDTQGLIFEDREGLEAYKKAYAKPRALVADWDLQMPGKASLKEVIDHVPVTVLLGACGVGGVFKEEHVRQMLTYSDRPIIFSLSNPTSNCEALPEDLVRWSQGQAIIATGSPFEDVHYEGKTFSIGQGNNVFIFPGVGLAAVLAKTKVVKLRMFTTASYALADCVSDGDLAAGRVYPCIRELRKVSLHVAIEVIKEEIKNLPNHHLHELDLEDYVEACMWKPVYLPYRKV